MDSWQPCQSHSRKVSFVIPWTRMHGLHIMEGSFAAPKGNLSFQPWKMRNRLGTLTQGRDWMAITCVVGFAFPPWKIKMFKLENSRWILVVSHFKTSKQSFKGRFAPSGCAGKLPKLGGPHWAHLGEVARPTAGYWNLGVTLNPLKWVKFSDKLKPHGQRESWIQADLSCGSVGSQNPWE